MQGPAALGPEVEAEALTAAPPALPVRRIDRIGLSEPARSTASSGAVSTHVDRERLARALARAGWHVVPALARAARTFVDHEGWVPFGYTRLRDFCRAQLHRSARWVRDLAALGAGIDRFPGLEPAITGSDGDRPLGRVAALCIARTSSESTFEDWLRLARRLTVREFLVVARQMRRAGDDRPPAGPMGESADVFQPSRVGAHAPQQNCTADVFQPTPAADALSAFEPTGLVEEDDDSVPRGEARLALPEPVDLAFDEVLDLHRAVSGGEASMTSLVEAMVGEIAAGPHPPDTELVTLRPGTDRATREAALERVNDRWRRLEMLENQPFGGADAAALTTLEAEIVEVLDRVAALETEAGQGDLGAIVRQLVELAQLEHVTERLLGRLLRAMGRHGDWSQLGFSGPGHYAEERLGMGRRTAECRAGIAAALRLLPEVRRAYESDELGLEAAWLLARVLGRGPVEPEMESQWVQLARQAGAKRVRDEVRRARLAASIPLDREHRAPIETLGIGAPGPSNSQADDGSIERDVASSTADGSTSAGGDGPYVPTIADGPLDLDSIPTADFERRVSRRIRWARRAPIPPANDGDWLASLRRWPGMTCERVWRLGRRALTVPSADVLRCFRLPEELAGLFLSTIESERRRLERLATDDAWLERDPEPSEPPSFLAAREYGKRLRRLPAWVGLLSMLEDYARTWDDPRSMPKRPWEKTYEDANYRCMAPGCTARGRIQDHHIDYRSEGGSDEPWNQLALCSAHHLQGEHGRYAQVRGTAPHDITWRLGIGEFASWWKNERRLDAPMAASLLGAVAAERAARRAAGATL